MRYQILTAPSGTPTGQVILADAAFMAAQYPNGNYQEDPADATIITQHSAQVQLAANQVQGQAQYNAMIQRKAAKLAKTNPAAAQLLLTTQSQ